MTASIVFFYKDRVYYGEIQSGQKFSIGSGKKEDIFIDDSVQVTLKWKNGADHLSVTGRIGQSAGKAEALMNRLTVLDEHSHAGIYAGPCTGMSERTLRLPYNCVVHIGRSQKNDVEIHNPFISGNHMLIRSESGVIRVEDQDSTNGTYLNGKRISQARLRSGDVIQAMNVRIHLINGVLYFENAGNDLTVKELTDEALAYDISLGGKSVEAPRFHRSPRTQEQLPSNPIVLARPPAKAQKFEKNRGMLASVLGTGAMFAGSMAMGAASPAFLAARAASLVSPVASMGMQSGGNRRRKKKLEEYEALRKERYGDYIQEQKARIETIAGEQRDILTRENPAPLDCLQIVKNVNRSLWERMDSDRDFLDVRLGMGYENLCVEVKSFANDTTFQMEDDDIRTMADDIIEETRIVDFVPARLRLCAYSTVGIIGERKKVVAEVRNLLIALTTAHFYEDVKIVGIFDDTEKDLWMPMRWLPHIWDDKKESRFLAFGYEEAHRLCERMNDVLESRKRSVAGQSYSPVRQKPHYIFILGSRDCVVREPIMENLTLNQQAMGVSTLFLFDEMYALPHGCQFIIDMDHDPSAYERDKMNQKFIFTTDPEIPLNKFDAFARGMSAIRLEGFGGMKDIPDSVTFLQGFGVSNVRQLDALGRWKNPPGRGSLAAPIGMMAGNKIFSLDIGEKAHGPHGLVAGTTGSGKSELLQTWILSMAVTYHPYDVSFVLIDYKGGGMANLLEGLPHVVGKITNIGSNIERSLISLKSENKRRLRAFERASDQCGVKVNHIDMYQRLYREGRIREPMPHLVIVADEFAELKKEEPEFMKELVTLSRVGRSLGIHLILATQKPSGVVDDQIWSNTRFRICLKVQDTADSREMIQKPDAASITRAGRAYIQVGMDEIYEQFQSFWSGAPYFGDGRGEQDVTNYVRVVTTDGTRLKTAVDEKTRFKSDVDELLAVVRYLAGCAREIGLTKLPGPWAPPLPSFLTLQQLKLPGGFAHGQWAGRQKWLEIPVGMYDYPEEQRQGVQYLNLAETGHTGIYGAPSTGKTTLLKTILMSCAVYFTPEDIQIYGIDCGGWSTSIFSDLPHTGGIALDCEPEKVEKLQKLLWEILEARKRLFLNARVSSLSAYREASGEKIPAVILAIDNLPALFELYPDTENLMITLTREGGAYGIYVIFTAGSSTGVRYKVQQNIKGAVAFDLTDKSDYTNLIGRISGRSLPKVTGRAWIKGMPPMMFQAAVFMEGATELDRTKNAQALFAQMNEAWTGPRPDPIPVMPQTVTLEEMKAAYTCRTRIPVGIEYEHIRVSYADLKTDYHLVVSGSIGCGKSRWMNLTAQMIHEKRPEDKIYIFDSLKAAMSAGEAFARGYCISGQDARTEQMLGEIVDMLNVRKRAQNQARAVAGDSFDEEEFIQSYEQICIFIDDLKEFVDQVSNDNKNAMERICRLAQGLGVLVFAGGRAADLVKYNEIESLTRVLISHQKGLILGGSAALCSFFNNDLHYDEKGRELKDGEAYLCDRGHFIKIKPV